MISLANYPKNIWYAAEKKLQNFHHVANKVKASGRKFGHDAEKKVKAV